MNGIFVLPDFLTAEEKDFILDGINKEKWDSSQSGRRKQNYGPKCNFKKNKIQVGNFKGFPSYSKIIHEKFKTLPILKDFRVIEQCTLEYDPKRGASIDPHVDDCWIWGERIVTVNVLGETYLSMFRHKQNNKFNLNKVESYPCVLNNNGEFIYNNNSAPFEFTHNVPQDENVELKILMPERSIIILYGSARYEWEHYIPRNDIKNLRICLAFREFTPPYLPGGEKEKIGIDILNITDNYW